MMHAARRFLGRVGHVQERLRLGVVDATNLHGFKEDALATFENDFALFGFVDDGQHLGRDRTRLTTGDGAVRRVA